MAMNIRYTPNVIVLKIKSVIFSHEIWQETSLNMHSTVYAECGLKIEYWTFDIDGSKSFSVLNGVLD